MHDTASLVLESVMNSLEAGASDVSVRIEIRDGRISVRTEDNGNAPMSSDPFRQGSSTKGEGRGCGLSIIYRKSDGRCRLTRGANQTRLSFTAEDDGSLDDLQSALLPIFNLDKAITVSIIRSSGEISISASELEKRGAVPDCARGISAFRAYITELEKGEIYG